MHSQVGPVRPFVSVFVIVLFANKVTVIMVIKIKMVRLHPDDLLSFVLNETMTALRSSW